MITKFETFKTLRPATRFTAGSRLAAPATCLALLHAVNAHAVAFRLPNQDPEAIARGNAFVATADNPSAIFYNPAGITQLQGQQLDVGLYLVSAGDKFTSTTGATAKTDDKFQPVPQLYYTCSLKDLPISFGLGVYVPYGLSLNWGDNNPFRTAAEYGSLLYTTINPVVAWKVTPELSIAAGPTINYSKVKLRQGISPAPAVDNFTFKGDDTDCGFNAGVFWQPAEKWAFGANYHYLTTMNYEGSSHAIPYASPVHTTASFRFPQYAVAGVSFRPTENWNFEVDIDWTDWDNVNQTVFQGTTFGNLVFPFNYQSSLMYEFGASRRLGGGYSVHAGYFYSENSIPQQTYNPIVPDAVLHLVSAGLTHKGQRWDWGVSYTYAFNPGSDVAGSAFGPAVSGHYTTVNHAINLSATLKF